MMYMVEINGYDVPQVLLSVKGVAGFRITYDDNNCPFSYHAMRSETKELAYLIPDMFRFRGIVSAIRNWGGDALIKSDWVSLSPQGETMSGVDEYITGLEEQVARLMERVKELEVENEMLKMRLREPELQRRD